MITTPTINLMLIVPDEGIYEALRGDFLDSHSLSLLNPYMVSSFVSSLICDLTNPHGERKKN